MTYKFEKDRGKFEKDIELTYVQLPHTVFEIIYRDFNTIPENSRMLALWYFIHHFYTNSGYESLKLKDTQAYLICGMLDAKLGQLQNIARWRCFDNFYKGRDDIDFEMALDIANQEKKDKKKERNKQDYQKRKANGKSFEERLKESRETEKNNLKEFINKHDLNIDIE